MRRRRVVSVAGLALAAPIAGCLAAPEGDETPQTTEELPVRFWLEAVSLSTPEPEAGDPIVFADLSTGEQGIVRTALQEGEYTVEPGAEPPALERLRDRIERRTGNGETLEAYLSRGTSSYRIGLADGDHIIAHPDH